MTVLLTHARLRKGTPGVGSRGSSLVDILLSEGIITQIAPAGSLPHSDHTVVDVEGRVVIPGLWDEHVHFSLWAQHRRRTSLQGAQSAADAAALMGQAIAKATTTQTLDDVVVGAGYRDGLWPDQKTTALLDQATGDVPTVLLSVDVHSCWANTAALRKFGVVGHDVDGVLQEGECFALTGAIAQVDDDLLDQWVLDAAVAAAARGVVGIVDLEMRYNPEDWKRRVRKLNGSYPLKVDAGVYREFLDKAIADGFSSGVAVAPGITMGPFKIITDGSLNTRTAHVCEPYLGVEGVEYGAMNFPVEDIEAVLHKAHTAGFDLAVHAIGDQANRIIVDLMEKHSLSGRIEHAQLLRIEEFPRFGELGIVASVQPEQAVDDRDVTDVYWADRVDRAFALRTLVEHGVRLVMGSDAPVAPLDPWVTIAAAVTRTRDGRVAWQPQEALSFEEALRFSTRSTIEVGQPADCAVLDADPDWLSDALASEPAKHSAALREMPVALTITGGVVTHSSLPQA
jgi:predicted amidohydrolase YtcJ